MIAQQVKLVGAYLKSLLEGDNAHRKALEIVAAFGTVLEQEGIKMDDRPGILMHSDTDLPCAKEEIRRAIELLLLTSTDEIARNNLEVADVMLCRFIPQEDYSVVHMQQAGMAQALKNLYAGDTYAGDFHRLKRTVLEGTTAEGQAKYQAIEERVQQEELQVLERSRERKRKREATRLESC